MAAPARLASAARSPAAGRSREAGMEELGGAFRRVFRALNRLRGRDTHLGPGELSHAQFQLLIVLREQGELASGELAAEAGLAPGTVTQMLDALAASGHVERARSLEDRRIVVTRLSARGRRAIEAKRAAWQARWEAALEGVGERELRIAADVLVRLASMFEQGPDEACAQARGAPTRPPVRGNGTPGRPAEPLL